MPIEKSEWSEDATAMEYSGKRSNARNDDAKSPNKIV